MYLQMLRFLEISVNSGTSAYSSDISEFILRVHHKQTQQKKLCEILQHQTEGSHY